MTALEFYVLSHEGYVSIKEIFSNSIVMKYNRIVFTGTETDSTFTVEEAIYEHGELTGYERINDFDTFEEAARVAQNLNSYKQDMKEAWNMSWNKVKEIL